MAQEPGGRGHSNMKMTYLCLPKYETKGLSVYTFLEQARQISAVEELDIRYENLKVAKSNH